MTIIIKIMIRIRIIVITIFKITSNPIISMIVTTRRVQIVMTTIV